MALLLILFALGVVLIVKGGDIFVDAASAIAKASGIPHFIIGATIVSIATTLPEIIVSTIAASQGKVDMAIGNAIGSVTANTGLILGLGILCIPSAFKRSQFLLKSMLLLLSMGTLLFLSRNGSLSLVESSILIVLLIVYIWDNLRSAKDSGDSEPDHRGDNMPVPKMTIMFILGTAGIVIGSQLLVNNGSEIAARLGIPENVIALTAISLGTSLPELVTAIASILKKEASLTVGNVIGANTINVLVALPSSALATKGSLPVSTQMLTLDIPVSIGIIALLLIPALIRQKFMRWQGAAGIVLYISYIAYICL